ncbi:MAG: ABC transporter permease [Candidatus Sulfotelmatobacter sp.]
MQEGRTVGNFVTACLWDIRYTFRKMGRDPGFAAISISILALAIGANLAVFSVVNTILLRPLPFPNSNELVWIAPPPQKCGLSCSTYSADAYDEFRAQSRSYQDVTGYEAFTSPDNLRLTGRGEPQPVTGIEVIGNFFQVLGVRPQMGRLFTPEEARKGSQPVTLLTNGYWRRQFAGDSTIIGKSINLSGRAVTVVGVLPESFDFGAVFSPGSKTDLFLPLVLDEQRDWGNIVTLIGRLKPSLNIAQAQAEARLVEPNLCWNVKYPKSCGAYVGKDSSMQLRTLKEYVSGRLHRSLIVLWCAVAAILLIACVNLSNLLLARAVARGKEFAVRGAVGAGRGRIIRQLLIESLVLSGASAVLGLIMAAILLAWLAHQGSIALPLLSTLHLDVRALGWTVLIAVLAAILFGLAPALKIASGNLQEALKDSGPGSGLGRKHERIRSVLVISEVALACLLLVAAGLLLRSFLKVLDIDLGFQPDRAASIKVEYDDSASSEQGSAAKRAVIFQQVLARVTALPGVEAAGMSDYLPLGRNRAWGTPVPKGKTYPDGVLPGPLVYVITPGFMRAMGIPIHGRDFTWADDMKSQRVVMINASAAHFYWPGEDAVGKMLVSRVDGRNEMTVVGVVDDVHEESLEGDPGWQIYYPATQQNPSDAQLVIRSSVAPATLGPTVLRALRELNPLQPAAEFRPMRTIVDRAGSPRRFFMLLVAAFAGLGLLLAALGIYGVISYSVTRQKQEIGVRMALGASTGRVQKDVLFGTLRVTLLGIALGTVASVVSARLIASLLFATSPWDGATYGAMAVALVAVALISGYLPARRASRINPVIALRNE